MIVEHLVVALGLAPVAVDRIVESRRRDGLEMHRLARERPEPEAMNRSQERSSGRSASTPRKASAFGEVEEGSAVEIEHPRRLATPGAVLVDDRRKLAVGIDGAEGRRVLLSLPRSRRGSPSTEAPSPRGGAPPSAGSHEVIELNHVPDLLANHVRLMRLRLDIGDEARDVFGHKPPDRARGVDRGDDGSVGGGERSRSIADIWARD